MKSNERNWFDCIKKYQLALVAIDRFNVFATQQSLPTLDLKIKKIAEMCIAFEEYTYEVAPKDIVDKFNRDMTIELDSTFMLAVGIKASITNFILSVNDPRTHGKNKDSAIKLEEMLYEFRGNPETDKVLNQILARYEKGA